MNILISNDDGYQSKGIKVLADALKDFARITVVAPDRNRSGASNSLSLHNPLRVSPGEQGVYYVNGTPTDCVHLGVTGLLPDEQDMVVSGINHGPNLGDDVLYSGTVAAAMEGRFLGLPAVAVSLAGEAPSQFESAARVAVTVVDRLIRHPLPGDTILNVNVPDLPYERIRGFMATRLGNRHRAEPVIRTRDPKGSEIFWIGPAGARQDAGPGTDFHAVDSGYVSITPLQVDLTRHGALEEISRWLTE